METCRTCAKCDFDNTTQWLDLFNVQHWKPETERIHIVLSSWKIKISCNDGLPQKICSDCFSKFCTVAEFRLQCLEAQQILSNIFDKIDTQSMHDGDGGGGGAHEAVVFESFEQRHSIEVDNKDDLTTTISPKSVTNTALESTTATTAQAPPPVMATIVVTPVTPGMEKNLLKTCSNNNSTSSSISNNIVHTEPLDNILHIATDAGSNNNTEVSFRPLAITTNTNDTAVIINENDKTNCCPNDDFLDDTQSTSITTNNSCNNHEIITEDTNDLDENDLIEELIDELDVIDDREGDIDGSIIMNQQDHNQNNIYGNGMEHQFLVANDHNNEGLHIDDEVGEDNVDYNADNLNITFECKYCYKWKNSSSEHFQTQRELLAHIAEFHGSHNTPYNCPYCEECFMDAASRTTHLKESHSQKLHSCTVCGKKYADKFNLRNHVEKYHSGTDFDCTLCAKSFCSSKSLNYHMKWHNPEEQLKCSYCDRLFINQRHLKVHEETHTGFRSQEVCSFCGKYFFHLKTLRWHIFRQHGGEKPYKCGRCPEVFTSYFEKRLHMLEYHLDNLTLIEKTECMLCRKRYENELILKDHMLEDHKENKGAVKIANNKRIIMNKKPKSFTGLFHCEKCDKRFNMKSALERHMAVHSIEGRPHACPQCPKRFKRSQDMKWHLKTHSSEKPNICDICGKGFALKYVLTQHRRSHEVLEKNFTCTTCGRSYLFEKSLRLHERIHSGKTYYKCDLCSESFVTHIKFKWHMKKMHDEEEVAANTNLNTNFNNKNNINNNKKNTELPLDDLVNIVIT
ncbi:oocyte zinc finger protein XlCOF6 [Musca domestica]|uniref:Oocyte zinc finger protein XlCOF6 n=1 Tax=Musca domestica TaxID=7370 RepID=A0A1I8MWD2_MUSDO|nr:oocyte zinc finger protein XlCOF6 [Musca domestica]